MRLYRVVLKKWINPLIKKIVFKNLDYKNSELKKPDSNGSPIIWFHGASAGELEALAPLIERVLQTSAYSVVATVFSKSGLSSLRRLSTWASENGYSGRLRTALSPWEGEWNDALTLERPLFFITSKYEAWPELWISLVELKIPLEIVAARSRKSLRIAKKICLFITGKYPELYLDADDDSVAELRKDFSKDPIQVSADPRWDRVADRLKRTSARGQELRNGLLEIGREYCIFGSFWQDDFQLLSQVKFSSESILWCVVPHDVNSENIKMIEAGFLKLGAKVFRSDGKSSGEFAKSLSGVSVLIINEVGVLLDLYAHAKWCYVGGGFSKGVHSTIEPALASIPVSCGLKRAEEFSEISFLKDTGQLTLLGSSAEFTRWLMQVGNVTDQMKNGWAKQNQTKLGASDKVWIKLKEIIGVRRV